MKKTIERKREMSPTPLAAQLWYLSDINVLPVWNGAEGIGKSRRWRDGEVANMAWRIVA